jgi:hypothetical protein
MSCFFARGADESCVIFSEVGTLVKRFVNAAKGSV